MVNEYEDNEPLGAMEAQRNNPTKIDKGKQREESLPFRPYRQLTQGGIGPFEPPPGSALRPAYFPQLSKPAWLPAYKPIPNKNGRIKIIPDDPPMPKFNLNPRQPFPDKKREPRPLHVRKSTGPEQIFPANVQGYQWAVAAGYDGCLLPNPALTDMLPKTETTEDGPGPTGQNNRLMYPSRVHNAGWQEEQSGESPDQSSLASVAQTHAYRKEFKPSNVVVPNTKLPLLRGVVVKQMKDDNTNDEAIVLPDIRKTVRLLVATLPRLSQGFLADHIMSVWKHREWHAIGVPKPEYPDWTARTIRKSRIFNRGHSNGYQSFGDFAQLDFDSASLTHFAIMDFEKYPGARNRTVVRRSVHKMEFHIFQHIVRRPELVIMVAKYLRVQELLILYSISKPFHNIVRERITGVIVSQAQRRAFDSAQTFPFRCFSKFCFPDPAGRLHPIPAKAMAGEIRQVPSFRWLLMVCYREMVCHEITTIMAQDGVPVPDMCGAVLKKIWLLMDIPDNIRRIGLVQNPSVFTDLDLFFATMFFVKLDMRFTDPVTGSGKDGMRRLLMAQPGLTMLWKTLKRTALANKLDVVKLFVRWKYRPRPGEENQAILGIPPNEIGKMQYEAWGSKQSRVVLQRPDELILKESIRRQLNLQAYYTDIFLWGYINPATKENYPAKELTRTLDRLEGLEEILVSEEERTKEKFVIRPVSAQTRET
ncbi:hypothetical protein FQN49_003116 [Arthroderma sp. PD_2]|nr:hypothetical protein FQN49_003116 [Arthroderma sp. PD_2]